MAALTSILAVISYLPQIIAILEMIRPALEKVSEVETTYSAPPAATKQDNNAAKHEIVRSYLKEIKLGKNTKLNNDDIDTIIKFVVLVIKKLS